MLKKTEQFSNFESALKELEQIVHRLESGELPLEQALNEFEQGIQLVKHSQKTLQQAEQRIKILLNNVIDAPLELFTLDNNA